VVVSDDIAILDEFTDNFQEEMLSMEMGQRFEECGKEYLCGFVAGKLKESFPYLVASPVEVQLVSHLNWYLLLAVEALLYPH
jgi:hypothetical protein